MSEGTARDHPNPRISCVLPARDEGASLSQVLPEVVHALERLSNTCEVIVVDDGSRDDTPRVVGQLRSRFPGLVLLQLSRNFGKEAALAAGLRAARGDVVIVMDADGQHPMTLLPRMLQLWRQGIDNVYGVRRTRADQSRLYSAGARVFYRLVNWGNRFEVPADAGDFRLMDRRVVDALNELPEQHRFMKGLYAWAGFSSAALPYDPLPRRAGKTHYGLRGALRLGTTGLLAFTAAPLRLFGLLGLALALASLAYGAWVIVEHFVWGVTVPGYATLATGIMFLSGIQLLSIGLLAEYVARIYDEVKRRPLYWIARREGAGLPPPKPGAGSGEPRT